MSTSTTSSARFAMRLLTGVASVMFIVMTSLVNKGPLSFMSTTVMVMLVLDWRGGVPRSLAHIISWMGD